MNFSLLDKILESDQSILATILRTEGHTYKKAGEKALFALDDPYPLWGNLGSLCVDQDIIREGRQAHDAGKPRLITIDTSTVEDVHFGYGTYCGGVMEILLEPLFEAHKTVYKDLRAVREANRPAYVVHNVRNGTISLCDVRPGEGPDLFIESVHASQELFVFGATPLALRVIAQLEDTDFARHIIDWRTAYLNRFEALPHVRVHMDEYPFDERSFVLIVSHSYDRDKAVLREALSKRCTYVGLLSSETRRNAMYDELANEGVSRDDLMRVRSPVGIGIRSRSDHEIAVSIVAELIEFKNA
jgi:xanthine dehydrogenase accessory factor